MKSSNNAFLIAGSALLAIVIVCATILVGLDKIDGNLFVGVVVGPIIGGLIGGIAGVKGVQSGAQATLSSTPDA